MRKSERKPDAASAVGDFLSSAYQRVPQLPYLDRATSLILIVCVAGYLGFTAYVFFTEPPVQIEAKLLEDSLYKNSQLALLPGENYAYSANMPGGAEQIAYSVRSSMACPGVAVLEQSGQESQELCILASGMLYGESGEVNANYGNRSILLFSPWMLAASENFSWKVEAVYSAKGLEMTIPTYFTSRGKRQVAGREAYEIDVSDEQDGAPASRFFIDAEKRVLLLADMGNLTVRMESAPFGLDWTNSAKN
jgi:hypothetical protein